MKEDLYKNEFRDKTEIDDYIYGSADVVGLMCLKVFTSNDAKAYDELQFPAMKLGSAFQKVNFLRDLRNDVEYLKRKYFPGVDKSTFNDAVKKDLIKDIQSDFLSSYEGIKKLPGTAKLPVLIAFYYYKLLLKKIKFTPAAKLFTTRVRVSNPRKIILLIKAYLVYRFRLI